MNLCSSLDYQQICFRLKTFQNNNHLEIFHEHVPRNRIEHEDAKAFLKNMVLKYHGAADAWTLTQYMNKEPGVPIVDNLVHFTVDENLPGRFRIYCDCHNVCGTIEYHE